MVYAITSQLIETRQVYNMFQEPVGQFLGSFQLLKNGNKGPFFINGQEEEKDKQKGQLDTVS